MNDERAPAAEETIDSRISVLAEISRGMVRLYKEQFGRGPTRARSDFAGPDTVICTLEDTFTPAERRLAEMDEHQRKLTLAIKRARSIALLPYMAD